MNQRRDRMALAINNMELGDGIMIDSHHLVLDGIKNTDSGILHLIRIMETESGKIIIKVPISIATPRRQRFKK